VGGGSLLLDQSTTTSGRTVMMECSKCGVLTPLDKFPDSGRVWINGPRSIAGKHGKKSICNLCQNKRRRQRLKGDPKYREALNRKARLDQKGKDRSNYLRRKRRKEDPEWRNKNVASQKEYYRKNSTPERRAAINAYCRERYKTIAEVRKKSLIKNELYALDKLNRIPIWCDREAIKEIYKLCPEGMEVDHIIPKTGELVSGLHVPENLQYLTPFDNRSKGNKFNPMEFVA